ncbi:hypothetical protein AB0I10_17430 [Streptomyces sp. NPDC050636]|uniref:hypothetical protein n=1 Tax=Streptomyces sp. NPDC050636 TaxID=3154510 RepID=UPI0034376F19
MREQQRREQGKAAAWCGRLLLFAALIAGIVTMHTFGHPAGGHGGHATLSAHSMAAPPMAAHATAGHPMAAQPTDHPTADTDGGGAMDPGTVCRAVLSFWAPVLLVLLGAGVLLGQGGRHAGLLAALRALLLRGLRGKPPPPRRKALARLSVLRV